MTGLGRAAATLPSWLDLDFARTSAAALAILAAAIIVAVVFTIRSIGVRLVIVAMMGAAVFGLLHYRQTLDHCDKHGCACKLFGEDLKGGGCIPSP